MTDEYIPRKAALKAIYASTAPALEIKAMPAADVVERPRWIPVTEALPESIDDDVLVTDGEGCAVGYWRPDAQAWDSTDFGWLENRSEPPCGIHTVTHWMPLPPLPEPPKEEEPDVQSKI